MARNIGVNIISSAPAGPIAAYNAELLQIGNNAQAAMVKAANAFREVGAANQQLVFGFADTGKAATTAQLEIRKLSETYDTYTNIVKTTSQATITLDGQTRLLGQTITNYGTNAREILGIQTQLFNAYTKEIAIDQQLQLQIKALTEQYSALGVAKEKASADTQFASANSRLNNTNGRLATVGALGTGIAQADGTIIPLSDAQVIKRNNLLTKLNDVQQAQIVEVDQATAAKKIADARYIEANTKLAAALEAASVAAAEQKDALQIGALRAQETALRVAPPTLTPALAQIITQSPQTAQILSKAGLGAGAQDVSQLGTVLANQGALESFNIQKDLVRQVTQVSGAFRDEQGVLQTISLEFDKSGQVITRFGSRLSGIGQSLNQLGRDFGKVAEFAIATTAIFGAFSLASTAIGTINDLNKSLTQFGITAQLSGQQSQAFFGKLADVAYNTATPLKEIVASADNIALATKNVNQTTQQWQDSIISLTNAVGIYTNLTGKDTVTATDLLTSTMKQLGIQADQLVGVLSKITAVAGGQAQAIDEITTAVSNLASLGPDAKLTLDQLIGISQALSQATPKTPDQIATSVKNLVGSLTNPAAKKAFAQFGIEGVDQGKNLIDIYTQVEQKIKSGVIPTNDIQTFIKNISGGPRRAPDAAALLDNLNAINAATQKSQDATNEAIVANAKLLDSTQAKLTQLSVLFDKFAFNKFADSLNLAAGNLASGLTVVLQVLNAIPAGTISTIVQIAALAVAFKAVTTAGKFFVGIGSDFASTVGLISKGTLFGSDATAALARSVLAGTEAQGTFTKSVAGSTAALGAQADVMTSDIAEMDAYDAATLGAAKAQGVLTGAIIETDVAAATASKGGLAGLTSRISGIAGGNKGAALALGVAGAGAALGGVTSGSLQGAVSGFGQAAIPAGILAFSLSQPEIGLGLLAAGAAISLFSGDTKDATQAINENTSSTLTAIQNYQEATIAVTQLTQSSKDLTDQFARDSSAKGTAAVSTSQLNEEAGALTTTLSQLTDAQNKQHAAMDQLKADAPLLASKYAVLYQAIESGLITPDKLQQLSTDLAKDLFNNANPGLTIQPNDTIFKLPTGGFAPQNGSTAVSIPKELSSLFGLGGSFNATPAGPNFDLSQVSQDFSKVTQLFDSKGNFFSSLSLTRSNITLIEEALASLPQNDLTAAMQKSFEAAASKADLLSNSITNAAHLSTALQAFQATGLLSVDQAAQAQTNLTAYQSLLNDVTKLYGGVGPPAPGQLTQQSATKALNQAFLQQSGPNAGFITTTAIPLSYAKQIADARLQEEGLTEAQINGSQADLLRKTTLAQLGIAIKGYNDQQVQAVHDAADWQVQSDSLDAALKTQTDNFAQRQQQLQADLNSGKFKGNIGAFDALEAQSKGVYQAFQKMDNVFSTIAQSGGLPALENALSRVDGLQNAVGLTAGDLENEILQYGVAAGLSGKQINALIDQVIGLGITIANLPAYKQIVIDIQTVTNSLSNLGPPDKGTQTQYQNLELQLAQDKAKQNAIAAAETQKEINKITSILRSGKGSNFGSTSGGSGGGAGSGLNVSLLDVPSPLNTQANEAALLAQAVKNARRLEAQIPGETKRDKNDVVELLNGTKKVLEVRGVSEALLTKALNELNDTVKAATSTTADTIRRIRVGAGDFSAIANVPLNSKTGVSFGGANGPINVTLNLNGTVLTPAQFSQFADQIASAISRQLASGGG